MNIGQLNRKKAPVLLNYSVKDSPHLTIETNLSCNIHCRCCYNINNSYVKSFEQICEEVDLGIQKRNLQSITLIGGEPTLHPDLVRIIGYIKRKKLLCQMLTNGIIFLHDSEDKLLDSVVRAGLDKILLHVDEGQLEIHGDIDHVILTLSATIFHDTQDGIPGKIRKYAEYRYFDGILALLSRNCEESSTMLKEYESISGQLDIEPIAYIPTSLDQEDISWLFFFFYINSGTGVTFSRSPALVKLFFKLYRAIAGRSAFALNFRGWLFYTTFLISSVIELVINPLPELNVEKKTVATDVYRTVYEHMEEI